MEQTVGMARRPASSGGEQALLEGIPEVGPLLDRVARLAAEVLKAPVAAVVLAGRPGVRLHVRPPAPAGITPGEIEPLVRALSSPEEKMVVGADKDPSLLAHLLAGGSLAFRFYATAPLKASGGHLLGTLAVFDTRARRPSEEIRRALLDLASLAVAGMAWQASQNPPGPGQLALDATEQGCWDVFQNTSELVFTHDFEGRFLAFSKALERVSRYSRKELAQMRFQDLLAPELRDLIPQIVFECFGGAAQTPREVVIVAKGGRRILLELRSRLIFQAGRPVHIQAFAHDVTERRQLEEALRESLASGEKTSQRLLRQTAEVARFSANVRELHRLSTTHFAQLEALFSAYLKSGCTMFEAETGAILGLEGETAAVLAVEPERAPSTHGARLPLAGTPHAEVAAEGKAIVLETEAQTYLGAPIRVEDALYGIIAFQCPQSSAVSWGRLDLNLIELMSEAIARAVRTHRLLERLEHQARHDALTGLPNRGLLEAWLAEALIQAERAGTTVAVALLDVDRFKQINDTLGHTVGDLLLQQIGERLRRAARPQDFVARMGGDEFVLALTAPIDQKQAVECISGVLEALRPPFTVGDGLTLYVTASAGISFFPKDGRDVRSLLSKADSAMYSVKNRNKDDLMCFTPEIGAPAQARFEMESLLRQAIAGNELHLFYQPLVLMNGELAGLEVLLVWESPKLGRVPARQFIPVAEEAGLIVPLGAWVLEEALRQAGEWHQAGYPPVNLAVNVSALQFARPDFVDMVAQTLRRSSLAPSRLELELTESVVMRDVQASSRHMSRLRALGVKIAIDDFGTGYSSLSYLQKLPIDILKIDRSFIAALDSAVSSAPIVQTIAALAHSMGMLVVAEGVENQQQFELVQASGCDQAQGHLFGEALPAPAVEELLRTQAPLFPLSSGASRRAWA